MKTKNSTNIKLLKISIILLILLFIIIEFVGIYEKRLNKLSNIVPEYNFTTDIEGATEFKLSIDDSEEEKKVYIDESNNIAGEVKQDEQGNISEVKGYTIKTVNIKANDEENLSVENYEKTKNIIENRLASLNVKDYKIRLDRQLGNMILEMKNTENTTDYYNLVTSKGKLEVKDYQSGIILIDNSNIENVTAIANSNITGAYSVYLQVTFNQEGASKLKEISNNYVATKSESGEENIKYITVELDGTTLYTTYFGEEWTTNYMYIPVSENIVEQEILDETYKSATKIANIINTGTLPVNYKLESNKFIKSTITEEKIQIFKYIILGILIINLIVLTVIFKLKGLNIGFSNFGFVALFLLVLRYFKIEISMSGALSILIVIAINLIFNIKILINNKKQKELFMETFKSYNLTILPAIIISLIYTLTNSINLISIGMVLFWGIIIFEIYNVIVSKIFIEK